MKVDFAELKPSVLNMLLFAMYCLLVIPILKFFLTRWRVPGLSDLAAAI
jgi:hypothetical protein